jgi:hypothetical protein
MAEANVHFPQIGIESCQTAFGPYPAPSTRCCGIPVTGWISARPLGAAELRKRQFSWLPQFNDTEPSNRTSNLHCPTSKADIAKDVSWESTGL